MSIEKFTGILRKEDHGFTMLVNSTVQNIKDLSVLGLYCYLASKPEGWKINAKEIRSHFKIGKDKVYALITHLCDMKLLSRTTIREKGQFVSFDYMLHIRPHSSPFPENSEMDDHFLKTPFPEKPDAVNPDTYKTKTLEKKEKDIKHLESPPVSSPQKYEYQETLFPLVTENQKQVARSKPSLTLTIDDLLNCNPFSIPEQSLLDWIEVRNRQKAPITLTAWDMLHKELRKFKEDGHDVTEKFNLMVASGWRTIKFGWTSAAAKPNVQSNNYYGEPTKGFLKGLKETPWDKEPIHGF